MKASLPESSCHLHQKIYIALAMIVVIGYWPVASGLFSVKNDDIVYFLPYRYNIVESIRNGQFPMWSPYLYMGLPVYGDMQSGVWNPFVWLLSLTGRYTVTTLHAELLGYVFLAGAGIYKLMRELHLRTIVCFTIAVAYLFSGFITDSGQILCWVSCAAFLPYTYIYFIRLLKNPSPAVSAKLAIANCLLLTAGGYPFFFIANSYFLATGFMVFFIDAAKRHQLKNAAKVFRHLLLSVVLLVLISMAPLCSFISMLPFYARGQHLPLTNALYNSYAAYSAISLLLPFSATRALAAFGSNEAISRNLYIGILLLPFILQEAWRNKTLWLRTVLLLTATAFALSLGELLPFRKWAYWYLPFMNTFRHPANFRLFVITGLLAIGGQGLHHFITEPASLNSKKTIRFFYLLLVTMGVIAFFVLPVDFSSLRRLSFSPQKLKAFAEQINFRQAVVISTLVQAPFLFTGIYWLMKKKYRLFCYLSVINVVVISQPQLFFTTVGRHSVFAMNAFIKKQPSGFPLPDLTRPVDAADKQAAFMYGYKQPVEYFFDKKVAISNCYNNPTILLRYVAFTSDSSLVAAIKNYPVMYIADSLAVAATGDSLFNVNEKDYWLKTTASKDLHNPHRHLSVTGFSANACTMAIRTDTACRLVILQNNYPGWKAYVDNIQVPVQTVNKTFIGLKIPRGNHTIRLQYSPGWLIWVVLISGLGLLLCLLMITGRRDKLF